MRPRDEDEGLVRDAHRDHRDPRTPHAGHDGAAQEEEPDALPTVEPAQEGRGAESQRPPRSDVRDRHRRRRSDDGERDAERSDHDDHERGVMPAVVDVIVTVTP